MRYSYGYTNTRTTEHPNGVPCVLEGEDSVYCEFANFPEDRALRQAEQLANLLNQVAEWDN